MWYPENRSELNSMVEGFLKTGKHKRRINGLIVPHAGYEYSGEIAGEAFSLVRKDDYKKAVIIGPSHYVYLFEAVCSNREYWETPFGHMKVFCEGDFNKGDIYQEHSIKNQVPFLQKLGVEEIMPLMIGKVDKEQAEEIAKKLSKLKNVLFVFSTDLSHFLSYGDAVVSDKKSIEIIERLDFENFKYVDACGHFPLLVLFYLCKLKKWKPKLVEYKNSGNVTDDKNQVVGYASFWF